MVLGRERPKRGRRSPVTTEHLFGMRFVTMARARIHISVGNDKEPSLFRAWRSEWEERIQSVSENQGCGCCTDIYDVEGPQEAIDEFERSRAVLWQSLLVDLRRANSKWSIVYWLGWALIAVALGAHFWVNSLTLNLLGVVGCAMMIVSDLVSDIVKNRVLAGLFDPPNSRSKCPHCGHIHSMRTLRLYRRPTACAICGHTWGANK